MQPNPDPKPGRWILPVVVLAMMGFAWLFINAADDPTVSASDTTTGGGSGVTTTTSTVAPADTTTTTSLPSDIVQYNVDITARGIEMAGIQERIVKTNDDWNAKAITYADTLAAFRTLDAEVKAWRTSIDGITVPTSVPEYANFHSIMAAAATEVSKTSGDIITGLQAPGTEARTAAVAAFNEVVTEYGNQVNAIAAYRPGSS